jgi:hypothetical protein
MDWKKSMKNIYISSINKRTLCSIELIINTNKMKLADNSFNLTEFKEQKKKNLIFISKY